MRRILDSLPCVISRADIRAFFEGCCFYLRGSKTRVGDDSREYRLHLGLTLAEHTFISLCKSAQQPRAVSIIIIINILLLLLLKAQSRSGFGSEVPRLSLSQARSSVEPGPSPPFPHPNAAKTSRATSIADSPANERTQGNRPDNTSNQAQLQQGLHPSRLYISPTARFAPLSSSPLPSSFILIPLVEASKVISEGPLPAFRMHSSTTGLHTNRQDKPSPTTFDLARQTPKGTKI